MDDSHTIIEGAAVRPDGGAPELARGSVLGGRFEIRKVLGRGGAGLVVQAFDSVLGEEVAVKMLRGEHGDEPRWIVRLAREVKLARQVRHPNVCRVFDFAQADGRAFLVMELAGSSLRDELSRAPAAERTLDARLADARAVAAGLGAVHAAGVVHRDVTPQNVLRMADGRLVVSDFGLATEATPSTSSLHGGTVAYMAPELARGEHATFASDVWALGAIVHEIVFGRRPSWREGRFGPVLDDAQARPVGRVERRIIDLCRRCMLERGRQRPRAEEVSRLVEDAGRGGRVPARRLLLTAGLVAAAAVAIGVGAHRAPTKPAAAPVSTLLRTFTGQAADWSATARVLAEVDGRVHGMTALTDGAHVRVVWGDPPRAEDIDVTSGARASATLPPRTERAGPPVPAPNGAAIAFEGYAAGGRPFVYLAPAAGDAPAVPVSASADPSLASEPRWLADSRAFVFDADVRNVGVFSVETNRATILPSFEARPSFTTFKAAVHDRVLVARITEDLTSQIAIFSWPAMAMVARFDLPAFAVEWQSTDGRRLHGIAGEHGGASEIVEVDLGGAGARRVGLVPGQSLRALTRVGRALAFASYRFGGDLWLDDGAGGRVVTRDLHAREVSRAKDRILVTVREGGQQRIVAVDEAGTVLGPMTEGPTDDSPSILPGGREWTYMRRAGPTSGFYRCAFDGPCRRVLDGVFSYATVSPDGARLAYVDPAPQGSRARLVELGGGATRELGDASSFCAPVWSSARTLWISRRTAGAPQWIELDIDSREPLPTGRSHAGTRDCTDGLPDPAAPVRDGAKIVVTWRSEVRVHDLP